MNGDLFEHKDPEAQSLTDVPTEQRGFFSLFTQPASASIGGSKVFAYLAWFAVSGRSAAGETPALRSRFASPRSFSILEPMPRCSKFKANAR